MDHDPLQCNLRRPPFSFRIFLSHSPREFLIFRVANLLRPLLGSKSPTGSFRHSVLLANESASTPSSGSCCIDHYEPPGSCSAGQSSFPLLAWLAGNPAEAFRHFPIQFKSTDSYRGSRRKNNPITSPFSVRFFLFPVAVSSYPGLPLPYCKLPTGRVLLLSFFYIALVFAAHSSSLWSNPIIRECCDRSWRMMRHLPSFSPSFYFIDVFVVFRSMDSQDHTSIFRSRSFVHFFSVSRL